MYGKPHQVIRQLVKNARHSHSATFSPCDLHRVVFQSQIVAFIAGITQPHTRRLQQSQDESCRFPLQGVLTCTAQSEQQSLVGGIGCLTLPPGLLLQLV
jgi:hypothetical protein